MRAGACLSVAQWQSTDCTGGALGLITSRSHLFTVVFHNIQHLANVFVLLVTGFELATTMYLQQAIGYATTLLPVLILKSAKM